MYWRSFIVCTAVLLAGCPASQDLPDASATRKAMQAIIEHLDSSAYASSVDWGGHVVLLYQLVSGREPTALEFANLSRLRAEAGLTRSHALALLLADGNTAPNWKQCADFTARVTPNDFQWSSAIQETALRLASVSSDNLADEAWEDSNDAKFASSADESDTVDASTQNAVYNTYFGYLHAHSELSDGKGTPLEAYTTARANGLDFFSLTDHGELMLFWPWDDKWEQLKAAAEETYEPGAYVTLWGFEWSSPIFGHLTIINSNDYTNAVSTLRMAAIYDWLAERPEAFGRFNHPGELDFLHISFLHFLPYSRAFKQMMGVELLNSNHGFDHFYYTETWGVQQSYLDAANRLGWRLAPVSGQDNHNRQWGSQNQFRTGVLATALTREAILEAHRQRRIYATEDQNLHLDFRCNGYPMGSRLAFESRMFTVDISDGNGDAFTEARLYRNGELLETFPVSGATVHVEFEDLTRHGVDYYYVMVQQADDNDSNGRNDEAISAPIWIAG